MKSHMKLKKHIDAVEGYKLFLLPLRTLLTIDRLEDFHSSRTKNEPTFCNQL